MNPIAWYSRLTIWIAALLLFVEAVSGRSFGVLTALSICATAAALLAFAGVLATEHAWTRQPQTVSDDPATGNSVLSPEPIRHMHAAPAPDDAPIGADQTAKVIPTPPEIVAALDPAGDPRVPVVEPKLTESPVEPAPEIARVAVPRARSERVAVATVRAASAALGTACPRCQQALREQQLGATCPECGASHHVTCWIENRFHCAREGCPGHGSLEEPGS